MNLHLPSGYSVSDYRFESPSSRERFCSGTERVTGPIVLGDLRQLAVSLGLTVPQPEHSRSKYEPSMLVEPLEKYFTVPTTNYDPKLLFEATRKVGRAFFVGKLQPCDLEKVVYDPVKSAGAPTFQKKGEVYLDELKRAKRIRRGESPQPVTVFHRGKNDRVARPVFGYPFAMTLLESRFFLPYQREVMRHHNPYVGGRSYPQLSGEVNELRWKSNYILELDYSGFDGSIPAKLIRNAFDIIKNCFVMSQEDEKDWEIVTRYFLTCPVLLPGGKLVKGKRHGVPSGSMFTQLIDSVVNAIAIEYAALVTKYRITRYHVLGDDSLVGIRGDRPSLGKMASAIAELGITVNLKKSAIRRRQDKCYFLGHYWNSFVGTRSLAETWEKVLTPERLDLRFFSKDPKLKAQAYVERLRAYQDDNPAAFGELQVVIQALIGKLFFDVETFSFKGTRAFEERASWDLSVKHMRDGFFERAFNRHLYHLGSVTRENGLYG